MKIKTVIKRDGRRVMFNPEKIRVAIEKAMRASGEVSSSYEASAFVAKSVVDALEKGQCGNTPHIECIQDLVEKNLFKHGFFETARAYIRYRFQRQQVREAKQGLVDVDKILSEYVGLKEWRINENANIPYGSSGLIFHSAQTVVAHWCLNYLYPPEIADAHKDGFFHIHDLGMGICGYCAGWSLRDLLLKGFGGVEGNVQSGPAKHFSTALGQMVNFLGTLQNEWAGAQAFNQVDTLLAPYVRKDKLTYKEVKQEIQQFVFSLNTTSRWGGQCVDEQTLCVTPDGIKRCDELKVGDRIYVFDVNEGRVKEDHIKAVNIYDYDGELYMFKNNDVTFLVTPNHRIVKFNGVRYIIEDAEKIAQHGVPFLIPLVKEGKIELVIITECRKVNYSGKVWCPTTDTGTFVAKREGHVFITGNSPFTNITLDFTIPAHMKKEAVVWAGKLQDETYADYQKEVDMINRAFIEVMLEGDYKGRIFSFPIPTYNITKDFNWDAENTHLLFEMTAKYGTPYFQNFINSDLHPEDVRSMCPLTADTKVFVLRENYNTPILIPIGRLGKYKQDYRVLFQGKWVKGRWLNVGKGKALEIELANHQKIKMRDDHLNLTQRGVIPARDLRVGDYLPFDQSGFEYSQNGTYEVGYIIGAYAGDGSVSDQGVVFSLGLTPKKEKVRKRIKDFCKQMGFNWVEYDGKRHVRFLRINSSAAKALVQEFVRGNSNDKEFTNKVWATSKEFRRGILQGYMDTDGGTCQRIYTVSKKMRDSLIALYASLGFTCSVMEDNRDGRLSSNVVYAIRPITGEYGDLYYKENGFMWVKIINIKPVDYQENFYCFTVENDNHLFTLGNGLVTHNCRLQLDLRQLKRKTGGLFGSSDQVGSIGVVTLNMPRLAYLAKGDVDKFFELIGYYADLARDSLEIKRKFLVQNYDRGLYRYTRVYLPQKFRTHFSTIGLVGMNEACLNLLGKSIADPEGKKLALAVLDFLLERTRQYQEETGNLYNLEATPAEGTSYRLARIDKREFPDIITAGTDDAPYYTNSTQLPVDYTSDPIEALNHQNDLQPKYTSGTVFHFFVGEALPSAEVCKNLVRRILTNYRIPYLSITPTFSICPKHGYISGQHWRCPECGAECEVYSRVVGYYRPVKNWNKGKQEEFRERKVFEI